MTKLMAKHPQLLKALVLLSIFANSEYWMKTNLIRVVPRHRGSLALEINLLFRQTE